MSKFQPNIISDGAATNEKLRQAYTTHSGSDIKAVMGNVEVANMSGISISVNREVAPIYVLGDANARAIAKNKRGIAGSIVMQNFDRWALSDVIGPNATYGGGSSNAVRAGTSYDPAGNTKIRYADQLPPFNITLTGLNDFNSKTTMAIYSVNLISEGTSISTEDNSIESQFTYVALGVDWFRPDTSYGDVSDAQDFWSTVPDGVYGVNESA